MTRFDFCWAYGKPPYRLPALPGKVWFICSLCDVAEAIPDEHVRVMEERMLTSQSVHYPVPCKSRRCQRFKAWRKPVPRAYYSHW